MKQIYKKGILLVVIHFLVASSLFAYKADVQNISSRDYFSKVIEVINNSEKSIHISMFVIALRPSQKDSVVYKLCNALIDAKKRGVSVKVILDQNIDYYDKAKAIEGKNIEAYKYLSQNGIEVFYDNKYLYTHSKALVIDEKKVIIGSTNWSYSAIEKNNESSVLIESPELAKEISEDFQKIKSENPSISHLVFSETDSIKVDKAIMNEDLAGRMITKHDERVMDLYLLLLYHENPEEKISFDYDVYAKDLGIDTMKPEAYRRQLSKSLRKLNEVYGLLEAEFFHGRNARVKLNDYKIPEDNYFMFPREYFEYGWNRKLSHRAKYCYMINLIKSQENYGSSWSLSRPDISEEFHLAPETITDGMNELRSWNLIEMDYSDIDEGYENRSPTKYILNPLSSPEKNETELRKLAEKYGKKYKVARKYAKIVYEENDPEVIEEIINLILKYPDRIVKDAYKYVGKKAKDNPKRNQDYAVAIINDKANTNGKAIR